MDKEEKIKQLQEEFERANAVIVFDDGKAIPYHDELPTPETIVYKGVTYLKTKSIPASEVNKETWWYYSAGYSRRGSVFEFQDGCF